MNHIKSIRKLAAAALVLGMAFFSKPAQAATPYVMSTGNYLENFSDIANWGNGFTSGIGAAPWSTNALNASGTIPDGVKITVGSAAFTTSSTSGIQKGVGGISGTGSLIFLTSGTTDNSSSLAVDLNLDFTGRNAGTLGFDWAETNNSTGNRGGSIKVYTSTDGATWSEISDSLVYCTNNVAASGTKSGLVLPTSFNGSATAKIRFYYYNGGAGGTSPTGSRPKISIDNVAVTSTGVSGSPPVITGITPSSVTTNAGNTVQYTVTSTGDAPTYFWYKETPSATNLISGANTATLTLANVLGTDTASYQVVLTNASGMATSAVVTLTVVDPALLTQPTSQTFLVAGTATFSVTASGTSPLSYQWYSKPTSDNFDFTGSTALSNGGNVSGANTNILTIANLAYADATNLFVVVNNSQGSVTSSVVVLTVANTTSLAYWNFNGFLNVTNPSVYAGIGTATAVNCVGFSNNISSGLDFDFVTTPPNAWGSSTYPAVGVSNKTAGVQFKVSTLGAKNINVSYDTRATATANKYQRLQYTTNGTDYVDFFASTKFGSGNYESRNFSLAGFPGVNNNTNFAVRIVSEFESTAQYGASTNAQYVGLSSTYATSGTLSFDIVNITGDAITNANAFPTITSFTNVITTDTNSPVVLNFTVGDAETDPSLLTVTAISSNQLVMPDGQMSLGGTGASRTLTLASFSNGNGVAPILVKVTDGNNDVTATWFYVTVNPGNYPPGISGLMNTNTLGNTTNYYAFTVADDLTAVGSLTASAYSGNTTLVPNDTGHVSVSGSGANRTLMVASVTNRYGTAPIYVVVNDGLKTSTNVFYLIVRPNTVTLVDDAFDYDTPGAIVDQSAGLWVTHSGTPQQMQVGSGVATITDNNSEDVNAPLIGQPYASSSKQVLYARFTLNFSGLPTATNSYFAHFKDATSGGFYGRIYATTATAASGFYRIGIGNASATTSPGQFPLDLATGVDYTVVARLVLTNGACTLWVNPTVESSTSVTDATVVSAPGPITSYALRESAGEGTLTVDNLKVALNFLSAVSNIVDVAPQASPDGYSVAGNSTNNVFSPLTNDVLNMVQGSLSLVSVSPTNGTATISGTNVLFAPTASFAGTATIGYTITDGFGGTSTSLMTVTVVGPSSPIPLNLNASGGILTFSWSDPSFSLQSSTNVAGPYVTIPGAVTGFTTNTTAAPAMFFRLKF